MRLKKRWKVIETSVLQRRFDRNKIHLRKERQEAMGFKNLKSIKFVLPNLKIPRIECMKRIRKARRDHVIGKAFARYGSARCLMHTAVTSNFTRCATTLLALTMITVPSRTSSLQIIYDRLIENGCPNFPSGIAGDDHAFERVRRRCDYLIALNRTGAETRCDALGLSS